MNTSVYQVVAYNLRRAREERGLSRKELSEHLQVLTGAPWNQVTLSQAENAWSPSPARVRHFDVNEVAAFAVALRVPIPWFFLPPPTAPDGSAPAAKADRWIETDSEAQHLTSDELASLAVPPVTDLTSRGDDLYLDRLRTELPDFEPVPPTATAVRYRRFKLRVQEALDEFEEES